MLIAVLVCTVAQAPPQPCDLGDLTADPVISVQLADWCRVQRIHEVVSEARNCPFVDFVYQCIDDYNPSRATSLWCNSAAVSALRQQYAHVKGEWYHYWLTEFDLVRTPELMHEITEAQLAALARLDARRRYTCDVLDAGTDAHVYWLQEAQRRWKSTFCQFKLKVDGLNPKTNSTF